MLRQSFAVLVISAATGLAGCASNEGSGATASVPEQLQPTQQATELAAFSAKAAYPETQPSDKLMAAAIVSRELGTVTLYNFTDKPIDASNVWVNRTFVCRIPGIAPHSKVTIHANHLYDSQGNAFAAQGSSISTVQLQTDHNFYNLEGPALE